MKKRNMKMTSAVLAAALAAVSLAGCGGRSRRGNKGRRLQGSYDL